MASVIPPKFCFPPLYLLTQSEEPSRFVLLGDIYGGSKNSIRSLIVQDRVASGMDILNGSIE